jgi:predicted NBD/HSP70 family sugar kinase
LAYDDPDTPTPGSGEGRPTAAAAGSAQLRPRGSNHLGMRQYNERVLLQAIRLHGELPKADLARLTHLSNQTVSLIINALLDDGLLIKREPLRGRIGQPSVPIALAPDGAYSVGVKIGRRGMDVILIDFVGQVRLRWALDYRYPDPDLLVAEIARRLGDLQQVLSTEQMARIQGIGIALPFSLGGWQTLLDMPPEVAARWPATDLRTAVAAHTELPVTLIKDTAAACVAELVAGRGRSMKSFLYLFVDTFVGGGLVLDSHLYGGATGNAGAVASMPLQLAAPGQIPPQLLSAGSLLSLQRLYEAAGLDPEAAMDDRALEPPWALHTRVWLRGAAQALAFGVASAACLLDIGDVVIDGVFHRDLLSRLIAHLDEALDQHSWEGVARPSVRAGTIGSDARALGGALLPLYAAFAPDPDVFLKEEPAAQA